LKTKRKNIDDVALKRHLHTFKSISFSFNKFYKIKYIDSKVALFLPLRQKYINLTKRVNHCIMCPDVVDLFAFEAMLMTSICTISEKMPFEERNDV
jgi:hypothetical protein